MCNQDIFAGYLCLGALHAQPSDAHLHHCCFTPDQTPPVPCSQHTPQFPANLVEMQSSATAKFSLEGHVVSRAAWGMFTLPTHLFAVLRGTTETHLLPRMLVPYWHASTMQLD